MRRRAIMCVDQNEMAMPDNQCDVETRPMEMEPCSVPLCNNTTEDSPEVLSSDEDERAAAINDSKDFSEISNTI